MTDFLLEAQELFEYTRKLRRDFHRHPELGFQEFRTSGIIARELNDLGLKVSTGIAKTGVVALLEGTKPGPVVLLRFDMDALPVQEATGAEYASQTDGLMHACGHDGHTAIGLTVARILHAHQEELKGTIKFVFQPAEEGLGGAKQMVAEGVLENPRPDYTLALHLWNDQPIHWYGVTQGPAMAASEFFTVTITGKGGHGASPHQTIDPIAAAAQIITALQTITSRNVPPLKSGVISVCTINGGTAHNIIPQSVEISGTIRTFLPEIRTMVLERFQQIVEGISQTMNCMVEIDIEKVTPATINAPEVSERVLSVAENLFPEATISTSEKTMGSEDMAYMMEDIPGCYIFIGSANSEKGLDYPHHHPCFDIDEGALQNGVALMASAAMEMLQGT